MHQPNSRSRPASTSLIIVLATMGLTWYGSFLFSGRSMGHPIAFTFLCIAEIIAMLELLGVWITLLIAPDTAEPLTVSTYRQALERIPPAQIPDSLVAVLVPVAGEPLAVIRQTVMAARDLDIRHRTVVLDDGNDDNVRTLSQDLGVEYLRRGTRKAGKAGNINAGLERVHTEFFAIFDSDQVPDRSFLVETLPHLLADKGMAFVQTPQYYGNTDGYLSGGCAEIQEVFYHHIQNAKNAFNAAFCVGTNVLFRRSAIDGIGGLYERSHSEDIWTSILLHEGGWRSVFLPRVLAIGRAPETVGSLLRQQFRWARGGLEILFLRNPLRQRLTFDQQWQYLHTSLYYLSGIAVFLYFLLPLLYAYLGWRPIRTDAAMLWVTRFVPYYGMALFTTVYLLGHWPRWRSFVIALSVFPTHIAALISVLTGINLRWSVTGVIRNRTDYVTAVAPQIILLLLSLGGIPLVLIRSEPLFLRVVVVACLLFNIAILFSFTRQAFPRAVSLGHARMPGTVPITS
ncbi:MAG: glycosyltransferase [Candidatus Peregrinibacteria bacterium]|nr:glycosyltransferase [Candidatus Peregrinibacteria bacterium]